MIDWAWVSDHLDKVAFRTLQHLYLAAIALAVGFAISFALGMIAARCRPFNAVADGDRRARLHDPEPGPVRGTRAHHRAVHPDRRESRSCCTRW